MKFFLDTEFHEYKKKPLFGKPIDTIELISIGIVSEDFDKTLMPPCDVYADKVTTAREYYAICKDFDVKAAWNSWQLTEKVTVFDESHKEYWLRENVLKPILKDLWKRSEVMSRLILSDKEFEEVWKTKPKACRGWLITLIQQFGKSRKVIAEEIKVFCGREEITRMTAAQPDGSVSMCNYTNIEDNYVQGWLARNPVFATRYPSDPEFYAYYADYDWVLFCWLFGRMVDLPEGFPWYCRDLQQTSDELYKIKKDELLKEAKKTNSRAYFLNSMSDHRDYPKEINEYNALADAKWNKELYKFLQSI